MLDALRFVIAETICVFWPEILISHPPSSSDSLLDTLSLPHLSFDQNLLLLNSNQAASELFGNGIGRHLSGFLRQQEETGSGLSNGTQAMMTHEIRTLASACEEKDYGRGVRLKVWAGEGMERSCATYMIQVQAYEEGTVGAVRYTMLFLRPAISKLDQPENGSSNSNSSVDVTRCVCGANGNGNGNGGGDEMDMEDSEISPQTFDDLYESFKLLGVPTKLRAERLEEIINNLPQCVSFLFSFRFEECEADDLER